MKICSGPPFAKQKTNNEIKTREPHLIVNTKIESYMKITKQGVDIFLLCIIDLYK